MRTPTWRRRIVRVSAYRRRLPLVVGAAVAVALCLPASAHAGVDADPRPGPALTAGAIQVFVTDHSPPDWPVNGMVLEVDSPGGTRTLLSDNHTPVGGPDLQAPTGIAVDAAGNLIVAENFETPINNVSVPSIVRIDRVTGARTLVSSNTSPAGGPDFVHPWGLAIEADGSILLADPAAFPQGNGGLIRIDPVTGTRTVLSRNGLPAGGPNFAHPTDVAVAPNGDIYVVDDRAVIRVDSATGARTLVSRNSNPAGAPAFDHPVYLTIDASGDILVADNGATDRIIRVDSVTGVRSTVSDNTNPVGGTSFQLLGDLVVDCRNILVVDTGDGAVLRVDATTGERTTISDDTTPGPTFGYPFGIAVYRTTACPSLELP
jgi:DNA-binding beta-propeller fold protein YncE